MGIRVCECVLMLILFHFWYFGPGLLWIEAEVRPIFHHFSAPHCRVMLRMSVCLSVVLWCIV